MPDNNRPLRVFLCHSSGDKPDVRKLYHKLINEGWIDPWLDEEQLYPGHDWDLEIEKAVESADAVIVCLSNGSVTKEGYVQRELRFVLDIALTKPEETIFIIPLRLDECTPPRRLRAYQYVNYFPEDQKERAYKRMLVSLERRAESLGIQQKRKRPIVSSVKPEIEKLPVERHIETRAYQQKPSFLIGGIEFVHVPAGGF